jgi:hypothetical protein
MRKAFLIIGFCVLVLGCKATYKFENNSSFTVTVIPEYGEDFQVQSGTVKSFESSKRNMEVSYSPSDYVDAYIINPGHWEFTNGDYYLEEDRGFIMYQPDSWEIMDWPGLKYQIIVGKTENNFAPNINFTEENNPFPSLQSYVRGNVNKLRNNGYSIISQTRFNTESGLEGYKIETNTENLLQIFYIFDLGPTAFTVTCSALLQSETDYDAIFNSSVETLEFLW